MDYWIKGTMAVNPKTMGFLIPAYSCMVYSFSLQPILQHNLASQMYTLRCSGNCSGGYITRTSSLSQSSAEWAFAGEACRGQEILREVFQSACPVRLSVRITGR